MLFDPHQLWRSESGHCKIARMPCEIVTQAIELVTFIARPTIVPKNTRPQDTTFGIKTGCTVHLSSQPDALDLL
jgi:hypothetical protein